MYWGRNKIYECHNIWKCHAIVVESIMFNIDNWARLRWWTQTSSDYWTIKRNNKNFQIFFRTRGALIDTVVAQIFDNDQAVTPPPSPPSIPPSTTLDPITPNPKMASSRYQNLFKTIFHAFISYRILLLQCSRRNFWVIKKMRSCQVYSL